MYELHELASNGPIEKEVEMKFATNFKMRQVGSCNLKIT